jgi:hypothetical protein
VCRQVQKCGHGKLQNPWSGVWSVTKKTIFFFRKLPCDCEGIGKEMPVIPVNRVVDKKRIIAKMEG